MKKLIIIIFLIFLLSFSVLAFDFSFVNSYISKIKVRENNKFIFVDDIDFFICGSIKTECVGGISNGSKTRCYTNIEKTKWKSCSIGWSLV